MALEGDLAQQSSSQNTILNFNKHAFFRSYSPWDVIGGPQNNYKNAQSWLPQPKMPFSWNQTNSSNFGWPSAFQQSQPDFLPVDWSSFWQSQFSMSQPFSYMPQYPNLHAQPQSKEVAQSNKNIETEDSQLTD